MALIKIENLTFSYPGSYDTIFENVCIQLDTNWKLGFIGRNGRGKTTLLNLLLGKYEYRGTIISSIPFDYFPYTVSDPMRFTAEILEEIAPQAEEWERMRELSLLDVDADVLWRPFHTLSNGEQTKVLLAALFLNEGRFLLIDEPTNHLDVKAREAVSAYLNRKKGFILVSHDRRFLDGCIDHVLSLNRSTIDVQTGNFSSWFENFSRRQQFELNENERLQRDISRLQDAARRASGWSDQVEKTKKGEYDSGFIGHKSAKMMKRAKSIEARRTRAADEKSALLKDIEKAEELKLSPLTHHADPLVSFENVSIRYGEHTVCAPVRFSIRQGERIVLDGKNGSGKSSLIKLLLGEDIAHSGTVQTASGLIISYVPQDTSHLHGSLREYAIENRIDESLFKTILRKMDFERVQFEKNMADFSGGQKKKVLIARSLCEKAHLYIWDEPLNFIDLYSRMQIESLLSQFKPTMLFVEHDKAFRDAIATQSVELSTE